MIHTFLTAFLTFLASIIATIIWSVVSPARRKPIRLPRWNTTTLVVTSVLMSTCLAIAAGLNREILPRVHDEFSYLLAAETYASGRWTNPPHKHWEHFESYHILQQPTYASKYFPGQGLMLAAGILLANAPIVGSWLGVGFLSGSVTWMLMRWTSPRWAFFGSVLAIANSGIQIWWGQTYWGGTLTMAGSALVVGALPGVLRSCSKRDAIVMGAGAAVLLLTRPFEGFILCSSVGAYIVCRLANRKTAFVWNLVQIAASNAVCLVPTALFLLSINAAVTGKVEVTPYSLHHQQYDVVPFWIGAELREEPDYRHPTMRRLYAGVLVSEFLEQRVIPTYLKHRVGALTWMAQRFSLLLLSPLLLAGTVFAFRKKGPTRFLATWSLAAFAIEMCVPWVHPHYFAHIAPGIVLAVVAGTRHVSLRWPCLRRLPEAVLAVYLGVNGFTIWLQSQAVDATWAHDRDRVVRTLLESDKQDLIIVRYARNHNPHEEWVYNSALIDDSPIVWAREMDSAANSSLLTYFQDRRVWLLLPDQKPLKLIEVDPRTGKPLATVSVSAKTARSAGETILKGWTLRGT